MPLKPGKSKKTISRNISDQSRGPMHQRTAKKFGEKRAHKQDIAIALNQSRKGSR